jgi:hypothetical protein
MMMMMIIICFCGMYVFVTSINFRPNVIQ